MKKGHFSIPKGHVENKETAKSCLPAYVESDYLFGDPELNYYGKPGTAVHW